MMIRLLLFRDGDLGYLCYFGAITTRVASNYSLWTLDWILLILISIFYFWSYDWIVGFSRFFLLELILIAFYHQFCLCIINWMNWYRWVTEWLFLSLAIECLCLFQSFVM
jgi:hypothetical protein